MLFEFCVVPLSNFRCKFERLLLNCHRNPVSRCDLVTMLLDPLRSRCCASFGPRAVAEITVVAKP